jgi:excisionase family DNA binding protein
MGSFGGVSRGFATMARTDAKKQEFIVAFTTVAAFFSERLYDGGGSPTTVVVSAPAPDDDEKLLSRKEVIETLDISMRTLDRFVKEKKLTPVRVTGRVPKFRKTDIEKFIRRRE